MAGCSQCSEEETALLALDINRSCLLVRMSDIQSIFISVLLFHCLVTAATPRSVAHVKERIEMKRCHW